MFDSGERLAKDLYLEGTHSRKDVLSALKLANLKTRINAVIGFNEFRGGQIWLEDPEGAVEKDLPEDKRVKNGPGKGMGRKIHMSEKAFTFDDRKWHCVDSSPDERLTVTCYTPCGIRQAKKGTRRILKRLGFVLPKRHGILLGSSPGSQVVPAMPCVETSVQEQN